ncbi:MAG: single-stranded DNA-binding protein [Candidatus Anammoximicrobium sp.]|nr:single-stranded DNA-binding protein [Candidatus Anammoximicrobium sp.]
MASYNRVILLGNLTRDIELKYTQTGLAVTEIGVAVSDRRKNQAGEWIEETTFVDVTLWGRTAEVASEYLSKGSPIFIEGRLKLDSWESEGQKRYKLRVVGERMQMLGGRSGSAQQSPNSRRDPTSYDESEYSSRAAYDDPPPPRNSAAAPSPGGGAPNGGPPPEENLPF